MHPLRHFRTITKHRHAVIRNCFRAGIPFQGLFHDLSKYSPTEFLSGAKYYVGTRSPNAVERETVGFSAAWMHHKGRNKHHYEYWTDFSIEERRTIGVRMPVRYLIEMFCDRVAASKIYRGKEYTDSHPLEYFRRGAESERQMHSDTAALLEYLLVMLAERGEQETFRFIKQNLAGKREYDPKMVLQRARVSGK